MGFLIYNLMKHSILFYLFSINCMLIKGATNATLFPVNSLCLCDLTGSQCDIHCCCDKDCSMEMIESFYCLNNTESTKEEVAKIDPFWRCDSSNSDVSAIFCIVKENNPYIGNYFQNRSVAQDLPSLNEILTNKRKEFQTSSLVKKMPFSIGNLTVSNGHIYGQVIDARIYNLNKLMIPRNIYTNFCEVLYPLQYLINTKTSCLLNVTEHCFRGSMLDMKSFLVTRVVGRNLSISTNYLYADEPCCIYEGNKCLKYAAHCSKAYLKLKKIIGSPVLINDVCSNALLKIQYDISWTSTVMKSFHITIFYGNISVIGNPVLEQQYSVVFHHIPNGTEKHNGAVIKNRYQTFYMMGDTVSGIINNNSTLDSSNTFENSSTNTVENLYVLHNDASGDCGFDPEPVRFGIQRLTGCRPRFQKSEKMDCSYLRSEILSLLSPLLQLDFVGRGRKIDWSKRDGYFVPVIRSCRDFSGTEVASGVNGSDADAEEAYPWQRDEDGDDPGRRCENVPRGVHMEIVYSRWNLEADRGALYRIQGVRRSYSLAELELPEDGELFTVPLSSSVKFTFISQRDFDMTYSVPRSKIPHIYRPSSASVLEDIFYPFFSLDDSLDRLSHVANCFYLFLLFTVPCVLLLRFNGVQTPMFVR